MSHTPIENLNLGIRPYDTLKKAGVHSIEQLRKMTILELEKISGMKRDYIHEIARAVMRSS